MTFARSMAFDFPRVRAANATALINAPSPRLETCGLRYSVGAGNGARFHDVNFQLRATVVDVSMMHSALVVKSKRGSCGLRKPAPVAFLESRRRHELEEAPVPVSLEKALKQSGPVGKRRLRENFRSEFHAFKQRRTRTNGFDRILSSISRRRSSSSLSPVGTQVMATIGSLYKPESIGRCIRSFRTDLFILVVPI
uniref:Uncharacterized protein n=1 Tax=Trichuris muris TaxID=70415 RepID=A0A5S6QBX1_TRIMR